MRITTKRMECSVACLAMAVALCGCPPTFNMALGNWEIQRSTFPVGATIGMTLNADGTVTPYVASAGGGLAIGNWEWTSNGSTIRIFTNYPGFETSFTGRLLSDTAATGDVRVPAQPFVDYGTWEAFHVP